jgi:chemotaxis receptor (MCP) glutamine deamidase CheD
MSIIIRNKSKHEELTRRIFKGQIILDELKKMVKIGQKNIRKLRDERTKLQTQSKPKTK